MRDSIKRSIGGTVQDLLDIGINVSFTNKELKNLGVEIPDVQFAPEKISALRKQMNLSQVVFAKILNVSPSSIRQWEQGKRTPSGSTRVLLELLEKFPNLLDYRVTT
jgi:putative transcriptional regulator